MINTKILNWISIGLQCLKSFESVQAKTSGSLKIVSYKLFVDKLYNRK